MQQHIRRPHADPQLAVFTRIRWSPQAQQLEKRQTQAATFADCRRRPLHQAIDPILWWRMANGGRGLHHCIQPALPASRQL